MRIGLLTSGGDAPGMNAAVRSVVRAATGQGWKVVGIRGGYAGIFSGAMVPMGPRDVANILQRGGSVLGAGRCPAFHAPAARAEAAQTLRRRGIEALVVVGGNGSYAGAALLHAETGMRVVGVPGSIDNDVGGTEVSIGFDTAVNTALDAIDRIRDTAFSHDRVFFVEVMGRHAGHIAAAVGLAGGAEAVLVPEAATDLGELAARIDHSFERGKLASIILVSEGDEAGGADEIATAVKARMRHPHDVRVSVLGHVQRGGSPIASDRILGSRLGAKAVHALAAGEDPAAVGWIGGRSLVTGLDEANQSPPRFDPTELALSDLLAGVPDGVRGSARA